MSDGPVPTIGIARSPPHPAWDAYVENHPAAKAYHHSRWPTSVADLFGLEAYYLTATAPPGRLAGVLPLVRQKSWIFGDRLTSLPYFNYGGALADSEVVRAALMNRARELATGLGVDQVEFRDTAPPPPGWSCRTDKATLLLDLPATLEELHMRFGSKLRSQIKRGQREALEIRVGGAERVADFYVVFAEVMRDLGTPVYPRRFFERLATDLARYSTLVTVHVEGRPVAGAYLVSFRDAMEIPWAASSASVRSMAINMVLYAEALRLAVERSCRKFDFGRSTIDSGPYRFKLQWGARPHPLYWVTTNAGGDPNRAQSLATRAWSRLPLPFANALGPLISPALPW